MSSRWKTSEQETTRLLTCIEPTLHEPPLWGCISDVLLHSKTSESFAAWSHLIGACLFFIYGIVRSIVYDITTLAGIMTSVSIFVYAFTFTMSVVYHVSTSKKGLSKVTQQIDTAAVMFSFSISTLTDILIASMNAPSLNVYTWIDVITPPILLVLYFAHVAASTSANDTYAPIGMPGKGTVRHIHIDPSYTNTRAVTSISIVLAWIPSSSLLYAYLPRPAALWILSAYVIGCVLLVFSQINVFLHFTDRCLPTITRDKPCYVPGSHGIWHIVSLIASAYLVGTREYTLFCQIHLQ